LDFPFGADFIHPQDFHALPRTRRFVDVDERPHQLTKIFVRADHKYFVSSVGCPMGQGANDIIGLKTR